MQPAARHGTLSDTGVHLDRWGFVVTGHMLTHANTPLAQFARGPAILETGVLGIFAALDVRAGATNQVTCAGEGATVALVVRDYLRGWWREIAT